MNNSSLQIIFRKSICGAIGLLLIASGILSFGCNGNIEKPYAPLADDALNSDSVDTQITIDPFFQGEYISPEPEKIDKGVYYTCLVISREKKSDSVNVVFSSAKIKKQICCSFSGSGFVKNDTLFVPLSPDKHSKQATMLITHNKQKGSNNAINVSMKDTSQADFLMQYCCPGASLAGFYTPCDLSHFQTDTTKANQSINNLIP